MFYPVTLLNSFASSNKALELSIYKVTSPVNREVVLLLPFQFERFYFIFLLIASVPNLH